MMEIRNPVYTETGDINCEINHPQWGWIPFTASANDSEEQGRAIYAIASEMEVAPYVPPAPPVLTAEQLVEQIRAAVQAHVDATARDRLYDSGNSLASYVASTNPAWAAEAQAFVAWRDAVWAQVYGLWAAPPEPWPMPEAVIADLPVINWPT